MSELNDARVLRLERLESRSMLAGGVLDFAVADQPQREDELGSLVADLANDSRPAQREIAQNSRQDGNQVGSFVGANTPDAPSIPASPPAQPINLVSFQLTTPEAAPASAEARIPSPPSGTIDAAIAELVSGTESDGDVDSAIDLPSDQVSTIRPNTSSQIVATASLSNQQVTAILPAVSDRSSVTNDGLIDLEALTPFEPPTKSSEPWLLDVQTIPLLNQIARRAFGERVLGDRAADIDRLMSNWFSGPGGLIALEQINLPTNLFPPDAGFVDVGLQSTIALHRSMNFVAGSVQPALSGEVLDAIMASLTKATGSSTQPIIEPSAFRVPTMVYPTAAVVATTIAIAARRKHKQPQSNLQFTHST